MTILVTRPAPDNESTAEALRARGFEAMLAPMLCYETLPFQIDEAKDVGGVVLTSTNAVRAIAEHPMAARWHALPAFAVGQRTADAARASGFGDVRVAGGDAVAMQAMVTAAVPPGGSPLLYLSAEEISRDIAASLGASGIAVERVAVYRMRASEVLPADVQAAFRQRAIKAVLHYSRRSAIAFVAAIDRTGIGDKAQSIPQLCLSEAVAKPLRDTGAERLVVARVPSETSLLDALEQALRGAA